MSTFNMILIMTIIIMTTPTMAFKVSKSAYRFCQSMPDTSNFKETMQKVIFLTGATDGIGLETARMLVTAGQHVLLHGRNPSKLEKVEKELSQLPGDGKVESYVADLSKISDVKALAKKVSEKHTKLDVLINNAGVMKMSNPTTSDGLDARFVVNTIAPYLLTLDLLPLFQKSGRIVNLSSAAQSNVNLSALTGENLRGLSDNSAYAQSKLGITMWTNHLARTFKNRELVFVSVNPASFLASKMVKEGYGIAGNDLGIGADILTRAALSEEFSNASGKYYDNDNRSFARPHPDGDSPKKCQELVEAMENVLARFE